MWARKADEEEAAIEQVWINEKKESGIPLPREKNEREPGDVHEGIAANETSHLERARIRHQTVPAGRYDGLGCGERKTIVEGLHLFPPPPIHECELHIVDE